jgi:NADH-quinone oxidoreductase subunit L
LLWVEPTKKLGRLLDWFDRIVIDGIVHGVAKLADLVAAGSTWAEKYVIYGGLNAIGYGNHLAARQWRQLQSGMVHHYAAVIVAGIFLLAVIIQLIMQL